MSDAPLRIAYVTSGAGGMYCGSCLHDNTLVRALRKLGVDAQLIPTYTPIRTDEEDVSIDRVFFGGISVYLQQKIPLFRHLPRWADRFIDQPRLIRWITSRGMETSAKELGELTVSMLRGAAGGQRKEGRKLRDWLAQSMRPDVIILSNMLIGGCTPALRELGVPLLVTLQGDDIFLDDLQEPYKQQALEQIRQLVPLVSGFIVNSQFYADAMAQYLGIPRNKFRIVPLGIDTADYERLSGNGHPHANDGLQPARAPTVGYLARLAKEKGLHLLVEAFIRLRQLPNMQNVRLAVAGWLGPQNRAYAEAEFKKLRDAGLEDAFEYLGSVDRQQKLDFFSRIDLLSVPTTYREPKGLFALESLAAGVPVVLPDHGAFPELMRATGGGELVRAHDPEQLATTLARLLSDREALHRLGAAGRKVVHERLNAEGMARNTLAMLSEFLPAHHRSHQPAERP